ncbi:histidine kinase [Paracrocinitomix mangrovi]|uniref:sensor histidine kinase n=1 Tax=Paracrocinitomix mangrovi TaxID=2862509 RepID=UPI001C8DFAC2|nr:sensor histidine kinase [Paracrocinitomix mangrovi]UKN03190.1 histidine kinase [Paracrocinitomix mangrovi]
MFSFRNHIKTILLAFILICGCDGYGQAYNFQKLSIQEGLPQSQAYAILFDSTQHVWIGTQGGGLCRYDGEEFEYFTKNDSLISNRVYCLSQIKDQIWVGQKGGVTVFSLKGEFIDAYRFDDPLLVAQDVISWNNEIYVGTDKGVFQQTNNLLSRYDDNVSLKDQSVNQFFQYEDDLWCATNNGLMHFSDPMRKINRAKGLSVNQINCVAIFDNYWVIGTYGGGVEIYDPKEGKLKASPFKEIEDMIILTLFNSKDNELWIGTLNNGVFLYSVKEGFLRNYQTSNGLSNNHIRTIKADLWDNIWIGTSGGGISIYQNSPFIAYNTSTGLNANYVYAVKSTKKNDLWVSTEGGSVVRINDTSSVIFDEEFGFYNEKVKALFEDSNGDIWIGTEGSGLGIFSQYDGKDTIYTYVNRAGLSSSWIKTFAQDPLDKTMYIGTSGGGVYMLKKNYEFPLNQKFLKVRPENGDFPMRINSLNFIKNQMWFTGDDGSYGYFRKGKLLVSQENGSVFRNCVGDYNKRWLGSSDNGVLELSLEGDSLGTRKWINTENGLRSNNIYQLVLNGYDLWVGTEKGLDKIVLDSSYQIRKIEHFGFEEGFEGVEANINAVDLDQNGNLWFGSVNGLYLYQGGEVNYEQRKPPVLSLNDFSIFYESIEKTEYADYFQDGKMVKSLTLPYDMNHIGFMFKAIHYTYSNNIRYRWRLIGADPDWTPPSKITTATYSNLQPGSYEFQVQASIDENWDTEPIKLSFKIDQPYYEKFWFKATYYSIIGFILLLVAFFVWMRIRRKNRALLEKFEMEKNLIELEQKALRLQMNPHFIFNVLTSIHNQIILNDTDKARYALSKFSKLMRRVLENSREKFISIDDEVETLENYVQLEKLTSNHDFDLLVEIDEDLDAAEEILPPLMIQPFVENAIIHGLKEIDYPGVIKVGFKLLNEHLLECFVEDNGRGRKKAEEYNMQKENYHKSTALKVTQERLSNLNQEVDFVPFEIIDLQDASGSPKGTKVVFRLSI